MKRNYSAPGGWLAAGALAIVALFAGAALFADPAQAATVVAVTDNRIAQYREALMAARRVDGSIEVVDVGAGDASAALKRSAPAVVLAIGRQALNVAQQALPSTPVVFCMVLGASGDGRRITGVRMEVTPQAQLEYFKRVNPSLERIGIIYDPRSSRAYVDSAVRAARGLGIRIVAEPVSDPKEVRTALAKLATQIDALWLAPDPRLITAEMFRYLLMTTIEQRIALFGFLDAFARAGALAAVSPDLSASGRAAAELAINIARSGQVPDPTFSPATYSLNLKTARRLGLDVPASVVRQSRNVYE